MSAASSESVGASQLEAQPRAGDDHAQVAQLQHQLKRMRAHASDSLHQNNAYWTAGAPQLSAGVAAPRFPRRSTATSGSVALSTSATMERRPPIAAAARQGKPIGKSYFSLLDIGGSTRAPSDSAPNPWGSERRALPRPLATAWPVVASHQPHAHPSDSFLPLHPSNANDREATSGEFDDGW